MDTRSNFTTSLRQLADWYDDHPTVPFPPYPAITVESFPENAGVVASLIRDIGACEKEYAGAVITIQKRVGMLRLRFLFWRSAVCERIVVGTKTVPEKIEPEHEEEIVEWRCEPILSEPQATVPA